MAGVISRKNATQVESVNNKIFKISKHGSVPYYAVCSTIVFKMCAFTEKIHKQNNSI